MSLKPLLFPAALFLVPMIARGDVLDDLDRGHRLLLERGLQLQALVLDNEQFYAGLWEDSNYTTVNFWAIRNAPLLGPPPGLPLAR
ncbi:MAG: hypothetical protein IT368_04725 [Candidatus Hydrogenedentes bacterium]|nr:hypothetical protein [Candidatus Hydrogenedentota bacterium]